MTTEPKPINGNRSLSQAEVLEICTHGVVPITGILSVVGKWVWITYDQKPSLEERTFLKEVGFFFNKTRGNVWQHACGVYRRFNRRIDPRKVYGQETISNNLTERLML